MSPHARGSDGNDCAEEGRAVRRDASRWASAGSRVVLTVWRERSGGERARAACLLSSQTSVTVSRVRVRARTYVRPCMSTLDCHDRVHAQTTHCTAHAARASDLTRDDDTDEARGGGWRGPRPRATSRVRCIRPLRPLRAPVKPYSDQTLAARSTESLIVPYVCPHTETRDTVHSAVRSYPAPRAPGFRFSFFDRLSRINTRAKTRLLPLPSYTLHISAHRIEFDFVFETSL